MSLFKNGRYSGFLRPISYGIDLLVINILAIQFFFNEIHPIIFISYISITWVILSLGSKFYEVYRYTREVFILSLIFKQLVLFLLVVFAFSGVFNEYDLNPGSIINYCISSFVLIAFFKFSIYYLLQKYRSGFGANVRTVIILGFNKKTLALENFFKNKPGYGYFHKKTFDIKKTNESDLNSCFEFILNNNIDEIYCSVSEFSNSQINSIVDFADNNLKTLKFLPDNKEIYSKKLKYEYYDYIPILSLRNIPLEVPINEFLKRGFDIIFSSLVIVCILSWLTPILALFIKMESRGPVFFKQTRNGINFKEFDCYKFRSMKPNKEANLSQATRDDQRVTNIGKFMRKTSIDELPQFFNVLFGDMSVVGPRPHMVSHTTMYAKRIDKFMVRHFVKPGITGLAQISGYRGEITSDKDIIGRVKYDIFYIENWSLLLDLKIVFKTLLRAVKGEEKAY